MSKPVLSIGIIFKNEIRCLERCLKSLQPLREAVPCELVMADSSQVTTAAGRLRKNMRIFCSIFPGSMIFPPPGTP